MEAPAAFRGGLQRQVELAAAGRVAGGWAALHRAMLEQLQDADALDWLRAALDSTSLPAKKGAPDGLEPNGPRQAGHEAPLVVDANGTPLGLTLTGANCHDSRMLAATLEAVPGAHWTARSPAAQTRQAARRQKLRPSLSARVQSPQHQSWRGPTFKSLV